MRFVLRSMEPGDVPQVAAIDRLAFPTPWPPSAFRSEIARDCATYLVLHNPGPGDGHSTAETAPSWFSRLFRVQEDRRVEGYVGFRVQDGRGHITTIALRPDWRGQGLGEYLLAVALSRLVSSNVSTVTLEMRPSNEIAYRLYAKYGFRVIHLRRKYYRDGEDAWVMAVDLREKAYRRRLGERRRAVLKRLDDEHIEVGQSSDGDL